MITSIIQTGDLPDKPTFPCLRTNGKYIVLFTDYTTGMVVQAAPGSLWPLGDYSTLWASEEFEDLNRNESVVLTND